MPASSGSSSPRPTLDIHHADNLAVLPTLPDGAFHLIYIDPPFNTGKAQARTRTRTTRVAQDEVGDSDGKSGKGRGDGRKDGNGQVEKDPPGDRTGYAGRRYRTKVLGRQSFADRFDDYLAFLAPRLEHAVRLLHPRGSLFVHLDCREVHYVKILLDDLLGRDAFINEIIWAYDYGGRSRTRWSAKHDNILWCARDPANYTYNYDAIDRIPYMAPNLVTPEKAARGKTPTDVWWHTIVSPTGREKTGYPTQKPLGILNRIVRVHSNPGDRVLDFFAGSGTTGEAAVRNGRSAVLIDSHADAVAVMRERLAFAKPNVHEHTAPGGASHAARP